MDANLEHTAYVNQLLAVGKFKEATVLSLLDSASVLAESAGFNATNTVTPLLILALRKLTWDVVG